MREKYRPMSFGRRNSFSRAVFKRRAVKSRYRNPAYFRRAIVQNGRTRVHKLLSQKAVFHAPHFVVAGRVNYGGNPAQRGNELHRNPLVVFPVFVDYIARDNYKIGLFRRDLFYKPRVFIAERFAVQIGKVYNFHFAPQAQILLVARNAYNAVIEVYERPN